MVRLVHLRGAVLAELGGEAVGGRTDRQGDDVAERAGERQRLQRRRGDGATVVLDEHQGACHCSTPISASRSTTAGAASGPSPEDDGVAGLLGR